MMDGLAFCYSDFSVTAAETFSNGHSQLDPHTVNCETKTRVQSQHFDEPSVCRRIWTLWWIIGFVLVDIIFIKSYAIKYAVTY